MQVLAVFVYLVCWPLLPVRALRPDSRPPATEWLPEYEEWFGAGLKEGEAEYGEAEYGNEEEELIAVDEQINCPAYMVNRPVADIARRLKHPEPVYAAGEGNGEQISDQEVVFVIAFPFTGSTAVLGLLGTSPSTTTHCPARTWACEGSWLLDRAGLMGGKHHWDSQFPKSWGEALQVYKKHWNMSKSVLLEKSPPNVIKMAEISKAMRDLGQRASFIVLTRSPCNLKGAWQGGPGAMYIKFVDELKQANEGSLLRTLEIKYEDLIADPWAISQRMVEFVPQLGSLNPAETAADLGRVYGARGKSVGDYALAHGSAVPTRHATVSAKWSDYMEVAGYP